MIQGNLETEIIVNSGTKPHTVASTSVASYVWTTLHGAQAGMTGLAVLSTMRHDMERIESEMEVDV